MLHASVALHGVVLAPWAVVVNFISPIFGSLTL